MHNENLESLDDQDYGHHHSPFKNCSVQALSEMQGKQPRKEQMEGSFVVSK